MFLNQLSSSLGSILISRAPLIAMTACLPITQTSALLGQEPQLECLYPQKQCLMHGGAQYISGE